MGNLCSDNKSCSPNAKGRNAPRDLNALLVEIRNPEDTEISPWAKKFRSYLKENTPELEPVFDFVIVCNVLRSKENELKNVTAIKWRVVEIHKERRELLNQIGSTFFFEDAPTPIILANRVLRDTIVGRLQELEKDKSLSEAYELVWQARCDYMVWKGGLDMAYQKFLRYENRPASFVAVLMSIL
ncbi:uncharacterized protein [Lepeophtheirus salmonis]|uniref:uncharacterized protein n=1 Tax=Lepeophtheirus salmonis TaxID=72036 RepID=UPI001AE76EC9|nr:uncharacterized protein LOC121113669 [Lepeophtheirus salmonis]XP_040563444.1 uncharacterized protein LOC121113669 [Lepeophtheirus salmonis]